MKVALTIFLVSIACVAIACIASAAEPAADAKQAARTKTLYESYCFVCHGTGWQGAPTTGIKSEWQPRMDLGWDTVLKNVRVGLNAMPAKGTCEECSDADFRALVDMMVTEQ